METSPLVAPGLPLWIGAQLGIAWPCGDRPAWVFPADRQWPAPAALESSFHHQET